MISVLLSIMFTLLQQLTGIHQLSIYFTIEVEADSEIEARELAPEGMAGWMTSAADDAEPEHAQVRHTYPGNALNCAWNIVGEEVLHFTIVMHISLRGSNTP